ncbi:MAG: LPS export ABC transporter periplasmic protein LptC [Neisseriaceae bacterium]|nr:LPS export ABC transporter periplasmic protein LptC [Neisseriaceae bacterium]
MIPVRASITFPAILMAGLVGISFWLNNVSQLDDATPELDPGEPQYVMLGADGKRYDEQGLLGEALVAAKVWQFPKSDDVHFEKPDADLYKAGVHEFHVIGDSATYNDKTKKLFFDQKVTLTKSATAEKPAMKIVTTALAVQIDSKTAVTTAPTAFEYGPSHGTTIGFRYDGERQLLNLDSRVRATYYDK